MRLYREFDRFLLAPASPPMETEVLVLSGPEEGSGELVLGASRFEFRWGEAEEPGMKAEASFAVERLGFPLRLRGWVHGDRIRLPYGTKKLKKLLHEAGIAAGERDRIPVLVEASGNVLWVVGVAVADRARPEVDEEPFFIGMSDAHQS
jgi:tRNA(Ile)-lysidine synthase